MSAETKTSLIGHAKRAAEASAHLYVWAAVTDILEGSATPGRHDAAANRAVSRVIAISKKEQDRCLRDYDKALAVLQRAAKKEKTK